MKSGDEIYIRNSAGKLTVRLHRRLSLNDVSKALGEDKLPTIEVPRWEFHEDRHGTHLITLNDASKELPGTMYVAIWEQFEKPEIWEGFFETTEEEERIYETIH